MNISGALSLTFSSLREMELFLFKLLREGYGVLTCNS